MGVFRLFTNASGKSQVEALDQARPSTYFFANGNPDTSSTGIPRPGGST